MSGGNYEDRQDTLDRFGDTPQRAPALAGAGERSTVSHSTPSDACTHMPLQAVRTFLPGAEAPRPGGGRLTTVNSTCGELLLGRGPPAIQGVKRILTAPSCFF